MHTIPCIDSAQARRVIGLAFTVVAVGLLLTLLTIPTPVGAASPAQGSATEGQTIFEAKCAGCHTIGGGKLVGPDLQGVTGLRDADWLTKWITDPAALVASGDQTAVDLVGEFGTTMPTLGLSPDEVASLIAYLDTTGGPAPSGGPTASTAPAEPLPPGDAQRGRELYTGAMRFTNGGPPCLSCHTIAGIGALGGGAMGPDHTDVYSRLGDAVITFPQTGTMLPIFGPDPLTPQEQADLLAFFRTAPVAERSFEAIWVLIGLAVLGALVLIGIAALVWRNRATEPVRVRMLRGTLPSQNHTKRTEG